ncbi:LacI family DNA-binding transcriptional regulator [uncultured Sphaerochaeta sp.]|uniref:LacI family DNA-binding transcriptional regulator n=1 Tax=uncultured Sphaerochaeta sp. TaxID=886478 RepID=UPI002A0A3880|nr:LacI family DNA-binding transcriptional regulator [uncultured Sphaerochaeta sp.]
MVSIKDIARMAGVSVSTVSRVLNDRTCVSADKRAKILDAIKQTGYVPNRAARDMVSKHSSTVGIVMPGTFNMFQRQLFSTIEHHLEQFGYHTSFYFASTDLDGERACLKRLKADRLDGIIILHEIELPEIQQYLQEYKIPTVLATFERSGWKATSIHISEEEAALTAVNHLLKLGHQKIAFIGGTKYSFPGQRFIGYKKALESASLEYDETLVAYAETYNMEGGSKALKELLSRNVPFTAVFAITDELALGAMRTLADHDLNVPGDVSVIGFDNIELASFSIPRLTTIAQPMVEMGQTAVALLHSLITSKNRFPLSISLPFTFVARESTAQLR